MQIQLSFNFDYEKTSEVSPEMLVSIWNKYAYNLPKCTKLSHKRKAMARVELKKHAWHDLKHWENVVKAFASSKFCVEKWRPGFDDFLNEEKRLRAIEGCYHSARLVS